MCLMPLTTTVLGWSTTGVSSVQRADPPSLCGIPTQLRPMPYAGQLLPCCIRGNWRDYHPLGASVPNFPHFLQHASRISRGSLTYLVHVGRYRLLGGRMAGYFVAAIIRRWKFVLGQIRATQRASDWSGLVRCCALQTLFWSSIYEKAVGRMAEGEVENGI